MTFSTRRHSRRNETIGMRRVTPPIAIALLCNSIAGAPLVSFESPCDCKGNHGKERWAEKNDSAQPPTDASLIQAVTPSDMVGWQGPSEHLKASSKRIAAEDKW